MYIRDILGEEKITVDSTGNDKFSQAGVYYYSSDEPVVEGNYWHYDENGDVAVW